MRQAERVTIPHVAALDGLRGAAVAGVLLFHGGHLMGGYLGVDLFFVLSGFLITSLLLAESGTTSHVNLGGFWARRARRLLPALGGLMVGIAVYCIVFAAPEDVSQIRGDALATLGYVANWRAVWSTQSYWELFRSPSPLEHTWSLAIEEQFYLVWPLVFVGLLAWWKARTPKAVLVTALLFAAISSVLMVVWYDARDTGRVYYGTDTRAAGILLGSALAAWLVVRGPVRTRAARVALEVCGLVGVLALAVAWTSLDGESPRLYRGGLLACGIAAIAVIASAAHPERGPISRALAFRPLCWLGLISYGLYLWHWPVDLVVSTDRIGLSGWPLFALQTVIAIAIAVVSYQLLEMPIRRGALGARQWTVVTPAAAAALVVLLLVVTANPARVSGVPAAAAGAADTTVLVIGDSVGETLVTGLRDQGVTVVEQTSPGCRIVRGEVVDEFRDRPLWSSGCVRPARWRRLLDKYEPDAVFLHFGTWDLFDVQPGTGGDRLVVGTAPWLSYYRDEVLRAVKAAGSSGAVVILPNIPCFSNRQWSSSTPSAFDPVRARAANRFLSNVPALADVQVVVPDLYNFLCPGGKYQRGLAGVSEVRWDGLHFTPKGSDLVAGWLLHEVEAKTGTWLGVSTSSTMPR